MPIIVKKSEKKELTKISCSGCGAKIPGIGLEKESVVKGLNVACKKCGLYNVIEARADKTNYPF